MTATVPAWSEAFASEARGGLAREGPFGRLDREQVFGDADGAPLAEVGPGAVVGERGVLAGGRASCAARKVIAARHAVYLYSLMSPSMIWVRNSLRVLRSCAAAGCS